MQGIFGIFSYFAQIDEDGSGFLDIQEVQSMFLFVTITGKSAFDLFRPSYAYFWWAQSRKSSTICKRRFW